MHNKQRLLNNGEFRKINHSVGWGGGGGGGEKQDVYLS